MKDRPILFSALMVRAILEGRKTQTRRVLEPQPRGNPPFWVRGDGAVCDTSKYACSNGKKSILKCKYKVGDRLWVRETWAPAVCTGNSWHVADGPGDDPRKHTIKFRADPDANQVHGRWRPSIFMPRWASRITLEVTAVKVERLQDISEGDAKAEGAEALPVETGQYDGAGNPIEQGSYRYGFKEIWTSIHGKDAWERNDWVAAYTFRRAKS